jgi:hypothetical protein
MLNNSKSCSFHIILSFFLIILSIILQQIGLSAATVVLKSGIDVKGKLIDRSDEEITIQDPVTKQMRIIKTVFIRDLILEPDDQKIKEKEKKGKDIKLRGNDIDEPGLLSVLQPTLGLLPGIAYPFGKLGNNLALGYGADLFCDVGIPMKPEIFKVRPGLSVGFIYHKTKSSDYAPSLLILPITAYMKFQFITNVGVRPFIKIGGGITSVLSSGGKSSDLTVTAAVGLSYINSKIPYLEFFLETGMMMAFEKVRGDFFTASVGVAYRFGAPATVSSVNTNIKK